MRPKKRSGLRSWAFGLLLLAPPTGSAQVTAELDAYWAEASRTVEQGDFEGYAALYHPDAVLVNLGAGTSYPIAQALEGWKQGFQDTRAGEARAGVTFRFTRRLHDETTAHETGIFRYTFRPEGGEETVALVHFEGLLVKKDGEWLMVMEYQKHPATREEWEAATLSAQNPAARIDRHLGPGRHVDHPPSPLHRDAPDLAVHGNLHR